MSTRQQLKREILKIREEGGTIDHLQIATDVQQELMSDLLAGAELLSSAPRDHRTLQELHDPQSIAWLGLTSFEGYTVVSSPTGAGIEIVYH